MEAKATEAKAAFGPEIKEREMKKMAVLETFLLDKLELAIEKAKPSTSSTHLAPDFSQLENDCRELRNLMEAKATEAKAAFGPELKEKLYYLNNLVLLLKTHHHLNIQARRTVNSIHKSLEEIKKKLEKIEPEKSWSDTPHKSLEEIKKDLENIEPKKRWSDDTPQGSEKIYRWSTRLTPPALIKIYGLEDRAMERMLVRTESRGGHKELGIVGMAGVGKTTLCQVAFDNHHVKGHFLPMIWVSLSKQPKEDTDYPTEVVKRILACLGFEDGIIDSVSRGVEDGRIRRLLFALRKQLKGKRYLIVLDGVWNSEDSVRSFFSVSSGDNDREDKDRDKLSYGLPRGNGGTVITTSRWRELAEDIVGEKNMHTLLPTADTESCWDILMGAAKGDSTGPPETLKELKDTIVEKCGGLPLVAKMMGQIVHEKIQEMEMTKAKKA